MTLVSKRAWWENTTDTTNLVLFQPKLLSGSYFWSNLHIRQVQPTLQNFEASFEGQVWLQKSKSMSMVLKYREEAVTYVEDLNWYKGVWELLTKM
jgi:hypothetical protein